ncbi:MAG: carboxymuconolactone decarboxylase family protein [Lentisphaeria bacterium]|jgi:AhpD family alkylhydroperoxidase|nr:carboxymuconolactone decarboxylase family protein [Lentisphaeria bacterium]MDP7742072.1 carboxymuconolactone decarboxylase family protein [Lentisphaeria bacterium]
MDATEFKSLAALDLTRESEHLSDRERQLVGMAVTATRGCQVCTGSRIEAAMDAGIPYETIIAAIDVAAAVNAGVTLRTAISGAEQYNIEQRCTGTECKA